MAKEEEFQVVFYHGKTRDSRYFTLAGRAFLAKTKKAGFVVSVSLCSEKDPFTKKIGRNIAKGRLQKGVNCITMPRELDLKKDRNGRLTIVTLGRNLDTGPAEEIKKEFGLREYKKHPVAK